MSMDVKGSLTRHAGSIISAKAEIRIAEGGILVLGEGSKIDDDVRIVIAEKGEMTIGKNVKIGKGSIVNCGGTIVLDDGCAIYGYCMLQTSIWKMVDNERIYSHGSINVGKSAVISPYSLLSKNSNVDDGVIVPPRANLGEWLSC